MKINRRTLIKAGAATAAASGVVFRATATQPPSLVIYDSRLPESIAFAAAFGGAKIDVAHEDANFWSNLRAGVPGGRVVGLTRWSDLVVVRGELERQGKRLSSERQSHQHAPFTWEMV